MRIAGWLLIVGGSLGMIGASTPPYKQWYSPLPEALRIIAAHPIAWRCIHAGFFTGVVAALFGVAVLAVHRANQPDSWLTTIGAVAFTLAAAFWILDIIYRLTITPWAANEFVNTGAIPVMYATYQRASGLMFTTFSAMSGVTHAVLGIAVLRSGFAPQWIGWTMLGVGVIGAPMVIAIGPWMFYAPFIMLGIALVRT